MAAVRFVEPVIRFCAVITRHPQSYAWAVEQMSEVWGAAAEVSPSIPFEAGGFYRSTMGSDLTKTLVAFDGFQDPGLLADWKQQTNHWEAEYASLERYPELRPINLDVGYMTQAKLVLATTKDRDHRIYLRDGMFAEVTLTYVAKQWQHHRWSYPSYRTDEVATFASQCRARLRDYLRSTGKFRQA